MHLQADNWFFLFQIDQITVSFCEIISIKAALCLRQSSVHCIWIHMLASRASCLSFLLTINLFFFKSNKIFEMFQSWTLLHRSWEQFEGGGFSVS